MFFVVLSVQEVMEVPGVSMVIEVRGCTITGIGCGGIAMAVEDLLVVLLLRKRLLKIK